MPHIWSSDVQLVELGTTKTTFSAGSKFLTFSDIIRLWQESEPFRLYFTSTLADSKIKSFFWETPPVTNATADSPFESVLVSAPSLSDLLPEPDAFAKHFHAHMGKQIVTFPNLAGDATLVVPAPRGEVVDAYTHLAHFVRLAPQGQASALWRNVGAALESRLSHAPTWLSTAGMGISWLHVRLDSRPKYYRHEPYKNRA